MSFFQFFWRGNRVSHFWRDADIPTLFRHFVKLATANSLSALNHCMPRYCKSIYKFVIRSCRHTGSTVFRRKTYFVQLFAAFSRKIAGKITSTFLNKNLLQILEDENHWSLQNLDEVWNDVRGVRYAQDKACCYLPVVILSCVPQILCSGHVSPSEPSWNVLLTSGKGLHPIGVASCNYKLGKISAMFHELLRQV